jgi:hypothetical protein
LSAWSTRLTAWSTRTRRQLAATSGLSAGVRLGTRVAAGLLVVFAALSVVTVDQRMGFERRIVQSFDEELRATVSAVSSSAVTECEKVETYHFACKARIAVPRSGTAQRGVYDLTFRDDGCWTGRLQRSEVQFRYPRRLSACAA